MLWWCWSNCALKCRGTLYRHSYHHWLWCLEDNTEFPLNTDTKTACPCSEPGWVLFNCALFYDDPMWSAWNAGEIMIENERVFTAHVSSIKTFYSGYILGRVKLKGTNYLRSIFYMANPVPLIQQSFGILRLILWAKLSCPCFHTVANCTWLARIRTRGRNTSLKQTIYMA